MIAPSPSGFLRALAASSLALIAAVGCSSNNGENGGSQCGPGTELVGQQCLPVGADDSFVPDGFGSEEDAKGDVADDVGSKPDGAGGGDTLADVAGDGEGGDSDGQAGDATQDADSSTVCEEGERICSSPDLQTICIGGIWQNQACPGDLTCVDGYCTNLVDCEPGTVDGCINSQSQKVCAETGTGWVPKLCEDGLHCFEGNCGTQLCGFNEIKCITTSVVGICNEDMTDFEPYKDCGATAICVGDECLSGCDALLKENKSYIGCEYWTVDLDQYDDPFGVEKESDYAIVISNPGLQPVSLLFFLADGTVLPIANATVSPGDSRAFVMPTFDVDGSGITKKSVQVISDFPVVAYQFNPLYGGGGPFGGIASNDASLLIPKHAIGRNYYITTWGTQPLIDLFGTGLQPQRGYFTVVAVEEGETQVVVISSAFTNGGPGGVAPMSPGMEQSFTLSQFDVLNIEADKGELTFNLKEIDLTGTQVFSDKNIVVFAGHEEAVISDDNDLTCCAEHLEEQLWPVPTWRNDFVCVKTSPRGTVDIEPDLWRVLAAQDGTTITTSPPIDGLHGATLDAGEWIEAFTNKSFTLTASGPLQVMQFTVANERTEQVTGDPSMILTVPSAQYRGDYTILTPDGYSKDFVTIIRPQGLPIIQDGNVVPDGAFQPVPGSTWEFAYVLVEHGVHKFNATAPFGLVSYGWSSAVSYGYPGGTNLLGGEL